MHVGKDADAKKAGLPLYPGARPKVEKDNDPLNFGILMENFGLKVVVAKYESDDSPDVHIISLPRYLLVSQSDQRPGATDIAGLAAA
jgi:hypothetical protein